MTNKILIIGDVHARDFWKEPCLNHTEEYSKIIFLGDYVDPYTSFEDTKQEDVIPILKEIINFKKANKKKVILLIGNHDMSYICDNMPKCRFDYNRMPDIRKLFLDNKKLFQVAYEKKIGKKRYIFTHSGILKQWVEEIKDIMRQDELDEENLVGVLNNHFQTSDEHGSDILNFVSRNRGGWEPYGSCVWGDLEEFYWNAQSQHKAHLNAYQVFGHTLIKRPFITKKFACVDAKQCVVLEGTKFKDAEGNLLQVG
jgi:predicted phosphodiesterase